MRLLMKASGARSGSALSAHFEPDDVPTRSDGATERASLFVTNDPFDH
jgi:hypothetical protein